MNINNPEELHPQQQVLPNDVIKEAIRLHQIFYSQIPKLSKEARATGMVFFYRFYEREQNIYPKEFALYAISCLHLGTKVCESAIPLSQFSNIICNAKGDPRIQFQEVFETLDGIPSYTSGNFIVELNQKLIDREMRAIITLGFNFEVVQPYDFIKPYIERILKWHLKRDSEFFKPLSDELVEYSSLFLNDLQLTSMFYIYAPELLAFAAISMAFKFIQLPLISPAGNPWYSFLAPNLNYTEANQVIDATNKFFTDQFNKQKRSFFVERKTKVPVNILETWLNYPYMPLKETPLCPPPPIQMLDKLVEKSDSFKQCELDHVPQISPPPYLQYLPNSHKMEPNPNLIQFQTEFPIQTPKKERKNDQKTHKKGKNSPSPSNTHHQQRQHGRDAFPPPKPWHHRRGAGGRRNNQDYDSEYEYEGYQPSPYMMPPGSQSERREPRWFPRGEGGGSPGAGNLSPPQRRREDGYFGMRDFRGRQPFTPPIGRPRERERDGRPFNIQQTPPLPPTHSPPPLPPPLHHDRDRFQDKNFYDDQRYFRERGPPPPGRGFRDERERGRAGDKYRDERGRPIDKDRDRDERERNRPNEREIERGRPNERDRDERGRPNDREIERERNRSYDRERDKNERERVRPNDRDRDRKGERDRKNYRHDENDREKGRTNDRNRNKRKDKDFDKNKEKNNSNDKDKSDDKTSANNKNTELPSNSKKDHS